MTRLPGNLNDPNDLQVSTPPPPSGPQRIARTVGDFVRAAVILIAWGLILCTTCAAAYVACRAIYWAVRQVLQALGG